MASELSRLIEEELKTKGYCVDDDEEAGLNQSFMGALRVEVG